MIREVNYNGTTITYNLERKRVKNINLRIKPDLTVNVSANSRVSQKHIDEFVLRKGDFILDALKHFERQKEIVFYPKFSEDEFYFFINEKFNEVYMLFSGFGIDKPTLKFRKMKSRWGSCNFVRCSITLNTNLIYCEKEQIDYVIIHEFAHLIVHDHSKRFYELVGRFCPDYKRIKKEMAGINI